MYETTITIVGNLTGYPELRYTAAGMPVARFRVASTPGTLDRRPGSGRGEKRAVFTICWNVNPGQMGYPNNAARFAARPGYQRHLSTPMQNQTASGEVTTYRVPPMR